MEKGFSYLTRDQTFDRFQAHNLKVASSNLAPATTDTCDSKPSIAPASERKSGFLLPAAKRKIAARSPRSTIASSSFWGTNAAAGRAPVRHAFAAIDMPGVQQLEEHPLNSSTVTGFVAGQNVSGIIAQSEAGELPQHLDDVVLDKVRG